MERWARERGERRQARARRKAQRTGEVNTGSLCLADGSRTMLGRESCQQEVRNNNGFNRVVFWFRHLTCGFSVMFRATTTSRAERTSLQEVGWIHGYVRVFLKVLLRQAKIPPVTGSAYLLCLQTVGHLGSRYGRSLCPVCFPLILHSFNQSIVVFLRALSLTSAHRRTQVGQLV